MGHPRYDHQVEQAPRSPLPGTRRPGRGGGVAGKIGMGALALVRLSLEGSRSIERLGSVSLNALPRFHTRPIDVVVYHGSDSETWFCGGFPA